MANVWSPGEDAIVRRHIAGEIDIHDVADLMPRRTLGAIADRARALRNGKCKNYESQKPALAPALPKGVTADAIAWAQQQPIGSRYHRDAVLILGWAEEGPVRL